MVSKEKKASNKVCPICGEELEINTYKPYCSRQCNLEAEKKEDNEEKCSNCGSTATKTFWDFDDGTFLCDKCNHPTRIGFQALEDDRKVRICLS